VAVIQQSLAHEPCSSFTPSFGALLCSQARPQTLKDNAKDLSLRPDDFAGILQDIGFGPAQHLGSTGRGGRFGLFLLSSATVLNETGRFPPSGRHVYQVIGLNDPEVLLVCSPGLRRNLCLIEYRAADASVMYWSSLIYAYLCV
jgi:hypothetical protein